jgi:hypothetical protein
MGRPKNVMGGGLDSEMFSTRDRRESGIKLSRTRTSADDGSMSRSALWIFGDSICKVIVVLKSIHVGAKTYDLHMS